MHNAKHKDRGCTRYLQGLRGWKTHLPNGFHRGIPREKTDITRNKHICTNDVKVLLWMDICTVCRKSDGERLMGNNKSSGWAVVRELKTTPAWVELKQRLHLSALSVGSTKGLLWHEQAPGSHTASADTTHHVFERRDGQVKRCIAQSGTISLPITAHTTKRQEWLLHRQWAVL